MNIKEFLCTDVWELFFKKKHESFAPKLFEQTERSVIGWEKKTGLKKHSTIEKQALKMVAEVGELAEAILLNDPKKIEEELGDVQVTLILINRRLTNGEKSVASCLQKAYDKIKNRKGRMVNGTFVKEEKS